MKIEAIFRQSTMDDIRTYWEASGRRFNALEDGEAVFPDVKSYHVHGGVIEIETSDNIYIYNVSDFYRWKVIK